METEQGVHVGLQRARIRCDAYGITDFVLIEGSLQPPGTRWRNFLLRVAR